MTIQLLLNMCRLTAINVGPTIQVSQKYLQKNHAYLIQ